MDGFSISKILLGLQKNQELYLKKIKNEQSNKINSFAPELNSSTSNLKQSPNSYIVSPLFFLFFHIFCHSTFLLI